MSIIEQNRFYALPEASTEDRFGMLVGGTIVAEVFAKEAERAGESERLVKVAVNVGEITLAND